MSRAEMPWCDVRADATADDVLAALWEATMEAEPPDCNGSGTCPACRVWRATIDALVTTDAGAR